MKIRNAFVSNSSSCSYVVDFKEKISSPEDLEKVLNKNFWKAAYSVNRHYRSDLRKMMPFSAVCELIFKMYQVKDRVRSGREIIENFLEDAPDSIPNFADFREDLLEKKQYIDYWKQFLSSSDPDAIFYAEQSIWERYVGLYEDYQRKANIRYLLETGKELGFFSFGNESELLYWDTDADGYDKPSDWSQVEIMMIEALRNEGLADFLFMGRNWEKVEYS